MLSSFLPVSERNLILTGYIGPETAAIGQQIAERLRYPFVNIERQIADRLDLPPEDIRAHYGESRLKSIEVEFVDEAALRRSSVIYVSGHILTHNGNLKRLQGTGPVIYLRIALDAMLQRLHMTLGARYQNPYERALALGNLKREWSVRDMDGLHHIDTTYLTREAILEAVVTTWRDLAIERG